MISDQDRTSSWPKHFAQTVFKTSDSRYFAIGLGQACNPNAEYDFEWQQVIVKEAKVNFGIRRGTTDVKSSSRRTTFHEEPWQRAL